MLVDAHHCAVDDVDLPLDFAPMISFWLQRVPDPLPRPTVPPAQPAAVQGFPLPILFRQAAPRRSRLGTPDHSVEQRAMLPIRASGLRFFRWQQRLDFLPLCVGSFVLFCHMSTLTQFADTP
jgi:hypothetical protein